MSARSETLGSEGVLGHDNPNKYLLATSLTEVSLGEEFSKTPPHITVLPPFYMRPSQKEVFDREFAEVAEDSLPFTIYTEEPEFLGENNDIKVMPVSGRFWSVFAGASVLAKRMGLPFDDTYAYRSLEQIDKSTKLTFGVGEEIDSCGGLICIGHNNPHVTDYEGVIEPWETRHLQDIQLFCYQAFKKVVSVYTKDGFESV
ncbi:MAG: hypothetical protein NTV39_04000 [Candidatus Saccharibacteria bacterium]|nr:hypothetical protein [Candidatus Saccharibacteria bacterium]